jgi:hypothetical protein
MIDAMGKPGFEGVGGEALQGVVGKNGKIGMICKTGWGCYFGGCLKAPLL